MKQQEGQRDAAIRLTGDKGRAMSGAESTRRLRALLDKQAITDQLANYCRPVDRLKAARATACSMRIYG